MGWPEPSLRQEDKCGLAPGKLLTAPKGHMDLAQACLPHQSSAILDCSLSLHPPKSDLKLLTVSSHHKLQGIVLINSSNEQ